MPTYSYACTDCDNKFDIQQSFSDDSLTVCPQCTGKLRKLFNSVGVVFKGSGFYRTDSRESQKSSSTSSSSTSTTSEKPAAADKPATGSTTTSSSSGSSTPAPAAASTS